MQSYRLKYPHTSFWDILLETGMSMEMNSMGSQMAILINHTMMSIIIRNIRRQIIMLKQDNNSGH